MRGGMVSTLGLRAAWTFRDRQVRTSANPRELGVRSLSGAN